MGAPRSFALSEAGARIAFVRSDSATSSVLNLWVVEGLDGTPTERLVIKASDLLKDDEQLSPAERARRERLRESGAGITGFSADKNLSHVVFALSGQLWMVDITSGNARQIAPYAAVVDPRLNPQGSHVAFTSGSDFVVYDLINDVEVRRLNAEFDTVTYGLADFIGAEELDRYRGHWWSPDGETLLVERNDEAEVSIAWISDPTNPLETSRAHRYPFAGTTNSTVSLVLVSLQSAENQAINWDSDKYEYLTNVSWTSASPLITVMTRDQKTQVTYTLNGTNLESVLTTTDPTWVDCGLGLPELRADGTLLSTTIVNGRRQVFAGSNSFDFGGRHVTHIVDVAADSIVVAAYNESWELEIVRVSDSGAITSLSDPHGYASALVDGDFALVIQHDLLTPKAHYFVKRNSQVIYEIATNSETAPVEAKPTVLSLTAAKLPVAVLWPAGHVMGSHKLPVVVAIYGGPHHSRVMAARSSFNDDQWLANQGFCVAVIDNRGTPGRGPVVEREVAGDLANGILEDQVVALQELLATYPADMDAERVGIHGWSFGGFLAALAVLDRPDVYASAWAGAPVTDYALYDTGYSERYLGQPATSPQNYERSSLIVKAAKLQRPLTLIQGFADDNVLSANSLQLSGALLAAGKPHNFLPLAGVSHMTPQEDITRNLMLLMRTFFDETLQVRRITQ